jgi:ribosomal protein L25 (general stress protein Ctc)
MLLSIDIRELKINGKIVPVIYGRKRNRYRLRNERRTASRRLIIARMVLVWIKR